MVKGSLLQSRCAGSPCFTITSRMNDEMAAFCTGPRAGCHSEGRGWLVVASPRREQTIVQWRGSSAVRARLVVTLSGDSTSVVTH